MSTLEIILILSTKNSFSCGSSPRFSFQLKHTLGSFTLPSAHYTFCLCRSRNGRFFKPNSTVTSLTNYRTKSSLIKQMYLYKTRRRASEKQIRGEIRSGRSHSTSPRVAPEHRAGCSERIPPARDRQRVFLDRINEYRAKFEPRVKPYQGNHDAYRS